MNHDSDELSQEARDDDIRRGSAMIAEDELRQLFAPRRPDAKRFAEGVADRLKSAGSGEQQGPGSTPQPLTLLDRAASLLPGIPSGEFFTKSWATILSFPALLLLGVFATFFRSNRRIRDAIREPSEPVLEQPRKLFGLSLTLWSINDILPALGSLLGIAFIGLSVFYGGSTVINTATLVILISMAALAYQIGRSARAGDVSTVQVGRFVIGLQLAALFGCVLWVQTSGVFDGDSALGYGATGWVLSGGVAACGVTMLIWSQAWFSGLVPIAILTILPATMLFGMPDNSAAAIRVRLASLDLRTDNLSNWEPAARMHHVLATNGEPSIDLAAVAARVAAAIEAGEPDGADKKRVHPVVWTAASDMGLVDAEHWLLLGARGRENYKLEQLFERTGDLNLRDYARYQLDILLARGPLSDAQRDHLAARITASWPDAPDDYAGDDLEESLACVRWLDRIGRSDLVEERVEFLHGLLLRHFVGEDVAPRFSFAGGFTANPDQLYPTAPDTSTALQIIERVGAPPELPLHHVRAFLRHSSRASVVFSPSQEAVLTKLARADYYMLTEHIGLPNRGIFRALLGERSLIAALLLVMLALRALFLAHRYSRPTTTGALP